MEIITDATEVTVKFKSVDVNKLLPRWSDYSIQIEAGTKPAGLVVSLRCIRCQTFIVNAVHPIPVIYTPTFSEWIEDIIRHHADKHRS